MDCLLETQGVGPEHAIHSAAQVTELGFDGVSLTVPPEALAAGSDALSALPGLVQTLRDADLTVPLLTCRITRPRDPKIRPDNSTQAGATFSVLRARGRPRAREGSRSVPAACAGVDGDSWRPCAR